MVPLAAVHMRHVTKKYRQLLAQIFILSLLAALVFCFTIAVIHFVMTNDSSAFFYHELVSPLRQHAVYISILVFIAIIYLLENYRPAHLFLVIFFSLSLVFLSSKLIIAFLLFYFIVFFFRQYQLQRSAGKFIIIPSLVLITGMVVLFATNNPVRERFIEITDRRENLLLKDQFEPGQYFDGLQFRILQWKWVPEILDHESSWLSGVTPGESQLKLDSLYLSKNMYTGRSSQSETGYLGYNTHNQFLESLLQNGIPGAILIIIIWTLVFLTAVKTRKRSVIIISLLFIAWSLIESVFETQYGIMIFCFFPAWVNLLENNDD